MKSNGRCTCLSSTSFKIGDKVKVAYLSPSFGFGQWAIEDTGTVYDVVNYQLHGAIIVVNSDKSKLGLCNFFPQQLKPIIQ